MINIIAVNIKQGGGLELLYLLIQRLIDDNQRAIVYVDSNTDFSAFKSNEIVEFRFYNNFFSKVILFGQTKENALYFGNIPPFFSRAKNKSLYYHNAFYAKSFSYLLRNRHYKFILCKIYLLIFIRNTESVFVQTRDLSETIRKEFGVVSELMPYFEDLSGLKEKVKTVTYDFSYISLPNPNKNLDRFLESLILLNNKLERKIKIVLTVPFECRSLIKKIEKFRDTNIDILNIGKVAKNEVIEVLKATKILVFPSLIETFGLPLIEGCQLGTFVICSDLPYAYDVLIPSATFDPFSADDIANTMLVSLGGQLPPPQIVIENKIEELIEAIKL